MIEIQHAFLTTGAPPPPARPPNGPAERCLADLTTQAERVHAGVQAQHEALDRVTGFESRVPAFEGMWESLYEPLLANVRAVLENEIPGAPEMQVNTAIAQCISVHLGFTEQLLNSVVRDSATTLTFWADALRISPAAFVRDIIAQDTTVRDSPVFSVNRLPSTAVDEWRRESDEEATLQWRRDIDVCNGISDLNAANACREAADVRECTTNIETFETWAARQSATYNTAALGFDRVAMELTRWVDGEVARAHDFAERHAAALVSGGSVGPGPDGRPMSQRDFTLQSINLAWQGFYNLNLVAGAGGVDDFIAEQARWFDNEKQFFEQVVASERESIESRCNPIIFRAELEALAREQWEAYRESLWDNVAANIEGEWDPTFDCEGSIGGFSVSLNDSGTAGLSAKWKNVEASIDSTGKRQLSGELNWGPIDFNARTTMDQNGLVSTSVGASGSVPVAPGVTAKGGISVVADGRRNEPALVFSGSLALGFERGGAGVSCSPGSGSLKVYPRAFTQAAVTYALTTR
jgi:hypothetical protein